MPGIQFKPSAISLALLGLIAFFVYSFRPRAIPVDLAPLQRGPMQLSIEEDGETRVRNVYLLSAPISGHLLRIDAEVGDRVTAGQSVLARLRPSDPGFLDSRSQRQAEAAVSSAQAALGLARAELRKARSQYEYAGTELIRARELAADNSLSRAELDQVELAAKTARATLDTAEAAVRVRQAELANARALLAPLDAEGQPLHQLQLRAPASGRILRILQQSEAVVPAGTPILEIGDPAQLEIVVDLLSRDAVRVRQGAPASITGWGGDRALNGLVRRIEPLGFTRVSALGIEEQRVNVIIDIAEPRERWERLGHGYRVEAQITVWRSDDELIIPTGALFRQQGRWASFRAADGVARLTPLQIGRNNGRIAQVLDGLKAGDRVILHPSEEIEDGSRITPRAF